MITWDIVFVPFSFISDVLTIFFSLSVTIGGVMVNILTWLYQCLSILLLLCSIIHQLLKWIITIAWIITCAIISGSSVVGHFVFVTMRVIGQYVYHGLSYLCYNIISLLTSGYFIVIWPSLVWCVSLIVSMTTYVINMMYNILTVFGGYLLNIVMFTKEFIQHTAGPFVACGFHYLFHGLVNMFDYCYTVMMTIVHYLTALMLRVIDTLPGIVQPLAVDIVYYGSDIATMVISTVFSILRWVATSIMAVTILLVTTPAFWVIVLAVVILSCLYYYYTEHWCVTPGTGVIERREIRQERNNRLQPVTEQHQFIVAACRDETDSGERKMEKFEEEMLCVVCQHEKKTVLLQPCNHLCLCVECVHRVLEHNRICPICRRHVREWIKVYL